MKTNYPLGRVVNHDPRSKNFAFNTANIPIVSIEHECYIPVLDQGQTSSCTGNAGIGAISTSPFLNKDNKTYSRDENGAQKLYSRAQVIDGNGPYPPNDNGSSGLSIAKALVEANLINPVYQHTFNLEGALKALMQGPILVGTNWHEDMFYPDADGRVHPTGPIKGGHEYKCYKGDAEMGRIWGRNSWGKDWGVDGSFYLTWLDFATLLAEQGDVVVPFPPKITPPAPTVKKNLIADSTEKLVASFEGLILSPYKDVRGTWTIGYGFTYLNGIPVTASTPKMTRTQADAEFKKQLKTFGDTVNKYTTYTLTQNQFDACVSLAYNIGQHGFQTSTVCRMINAGKMQAAADAFLLWNKVAGKVNAVQVARRAKERGIFLQLAKVTYSGNKFVLYLKAKLTALLAQRQ